MRDPSLVSPRNSLAIQVCAPPHNHPGNLLNHDEVPVFTPPFHLSNSSSDIGPSTRRLRFFLSNLPPLFFVLVVPNSSITKYSFHPFLSPSCRDN